MDPQMVVLASASPRRAELLRQLVPRFRIIPGQAEEIHADFLTPHETCQLNAYRKARAVSRAHPAALVLGADTMVCLGRELFGKPRNLRHAEQMLARLAGRTHEVVTGVCLLHRRENRRQLFAVSTRVTFRPLQPGEIRSYLAKIDPLDKAGAYALQEHGAMIVEEIAGSYSNVVGLPLERLRQELEQWPRTAPPPAPKPASRPERRAAVPVA
jgi:septum formation protein